MIVEQVWYTPYYGLTNVVNIYVCSLRHEVDEEFSEKLIKTIHRQGYALSVTGEEQRETRKCAQKGLL
jgi:DNA-binding response OmpR family regulator